jgi:uroporphyrinogen-III decarboxylase
MMQNQLLERVVPGVLLRDDSPLSIRNNHGTIQVASVLGGDWKLHQDNYPWVEPFHSMDRIDDVANSTGPVADDAGILKKSLDTLAFYREKLAEHPPLDKAIQVSLPDLQGPIDTAEQLWGSEIYYGVVDRPELFEKLLSRIVDVQLDMASRFRKLATDRLDPVATTQHGWQVPGRILIRNDSSIMLSPEMYAEHVRPHDSRLLHDIGKGSIHFCGSGQHLIEPMLEIPDMLGLDFGEIHLMDAKWIYDTCRELSVSVLPYRPSDDDLISGKAAREYPTGVVFTYSAESWEDAGGVAQGYCEARGTSQ